jgi:hypothetical protein
MSPVNKKLREKRRKEQQRQSVLPPMFKTLFFKPTDRQGELSARIDNLEVGFFPEDGCYIVVWGTETGLPCDYTDSDCPEDKNRNWKNCPKADNCPYEFTRPIQEYCSVFTNEGTRTELEARIRKMFITGNDGDLG